MSNEIIESIEDLKDFKLNPNDKYAETYEGFKIKTTEQEVYLLINGFPNCCESFGHMISEDDPSYFIGAKLLEIKNVDIALNDKSNPGGLDEGAAMFVNIETDRGTLQLSVYNSHNGFYGHSVKLISKQLSLEKSL